MKRVLRLKRRGSESDPKGAEIENWVDTKLIAEYVTVALHDYEQEDRRRSDAPDQFRGIFGELAFVQYLVSLGLIENVDFEYVDREINYLKRKGSLPSCDIKLKSGELKGKTIEIATVKPPHIHQYCVFPDHKIERGFDFGVPVQIMELECCAKIRRKGEYQWFKIDAESDKPILITDKSDFGKPPVGKAAVIGYAPFSEILEWKHGNPPNPPTTKVPGRYELLKEIQKRHPRTELQEILNPSLKPKRERLDFYG